MNPVYHMNFESKVKTEIDVTRSDVIDSELSTVAHGFLFTETDTLILLF